VSLLVDPNEPAELKRKIFQTADLNAQEVQIRMKFVNEKGEQFEERIFDFVDSEFIFGIERKSEKDYWSSLVSTENHLFSQADKIKDFQGRKYLIFEGSLETLLWEHKGDPEKDQSKSENRDQTNFILSSFAKLSNDPYNIHILYTLDYDTTVAMLKFLFKYRKGVPQKDLISRKDHSVPPQIQAMCAVKGVDEIISYNLFRFFPSLRVMSSMPVEVLSVVDKVGPVKAQAIFDFYNTPINVDAIIDANKRRK
jgi:ERCC4-type nuclease